MSLADVRIDNDGRTLFAVITGEVDMSNAPSIRLQIAESVTPEHDALIVDLSELSFIDSAGLHALIELGTVLDERRQQLLLCVPPGSQIRRAIEIVGDEVVRRTYVDALAPFRQPDGSYRQNNVFRYFVAARRD